MIPEIDTDQYSIELLRLADRFAVLDRLRMRSATMSNCSKQNGGLPEVIPERNKEMGVTLGRMYRDVNGISGATILGDGRVALILDLPQLARQAEQGERQYCDEAM